MDRSKRKPASVVVWNRAMVGPNWQREAAPEKVATGRLIMVGCNAALKRPVAILPC
jgi:hypothetical protein